MPIDLVTRTAWGARAPKGSYSPLSSTRGVKVHYTGGRIDPRMLDDHARCIAAVQAIQRMHMESNGWIDLGYSALACWHRKVFVGRGPRHVPAANGSGLNSGHYAVCGLVGNSGLVEPNDAMLHGILDAIEWLRAEGGAGREIKGHRDGYATDCPGGPLYAWVKRGAPRPGGNTPKPTPKPPAKAVEPMEPPPFHHELRLTSPLMHDDHVRAWQGRAREHVRDLRVDGWYGDQSRTACRDLQRLLGIPVTGVVDATTWDLTWLWDPGT